MVIDWPSGLVIVRLATWGWSTAGASTIRVESPTTPMTRTGTPSILTVLRLVKLDPKITTWVPVTGIREGDTESKPGAGITSSVGRVVVVVVGVSTGSVVVVVCSGSGSTGTVVVVVLVVLVVVVVVVAG